jgi:hypothetical protein
MLLLYAGDTARLLPDDSEHMITMKDPLGRSFECKLPAAPPNVTGPSTGQSSEVLPAFSSHDAVAGRCAACWPVVAVKGEPS